MSAEIERSSGEYKLSDGKLKVTTILEVPSKEEVSEDDGPGSIFMAEGQMSYLDPDGSVQVLVTMDRVIELIKQYGGSPPIEPIYIFDGNGSISDGIFDGNGPIDTTNILDGNG